MSVSAVKTSLSFLLNTEDTASTSISNSDELRCSHASIQTKLKVRVGGVRKPRVRRFICESCSFPFYTNSDLQKHIISVHLRLRPYGCSDCGRRFGERSNLTKHFKSVHERQRNAACDQCDAVFAFRDGLARHKRLVHEGLRKFQCPVPNCKSTPFKQSAHLKKHMQSVHKMSVEEIGNALRGSCRTRHGPLSQSSCLD